MADAVRVALLGYGLGNVPVVRDNFNVIVWGIMAVTLVLVAVEWLKARRRKRQALAGEASPGGRG